MSSALGHLSKVRHVTVGVAVVATTMLAAIGVIGDGNPPERFDTWQTVVAPAGGDGLRITETFDQDFGDNRRHGPTRVIPNDFGTPIDVVASSPDAPADVSVTDEGFETVIRIGDPDVTVTGQHHYVVSYTLPDAELSSGMLAIDALAGDEFETDLAEVVISGFVLDEPHCFVGTAGSEQRCDLEVVGDTYRARFEPLPPFTGVTIEGAIVGSVTPGLVEPLPTPDPRPDRRLALALAVAVLGSLAGLGVYLWARRKGSNEVFAGGAADAAYGELPEPGLAGAARQVATARVADDRLDELATIEFVPPAGIAPWEAAALLTERLGDGLIEAWLSGLAGREAIELASPDDDLTIASGPRRGELDEVDEKLLANLMGGDDPYVTGTYDPAFAEAWGAVGLMQRERIAQSGWWKQLPPGGGRGSGGRSFSGVILVAVFALVWFGSAVSAVIGLFSSWPAALAVGILFPAGVAYFVYRVMLPARSAQGSALALRSESFRRFLHASEARHVEWAWTHGLLREYSGWAVALGEADAWSDALARSNVPEPQRASVIPAMIVGRSSITSSWVAPSSSGSSSSFGGSSGSVGGGGGGGSRGSW